jgi:hypothetical protein
MGQPSQASFPPLHQLLVYIATVYTARRIEPILLSLYGLNSAQAFSRGLQPTLAEGPDGERPRSEASSLDTPLATSTTSLTVLTTPRRSQSQIVVSDEVESYQPLARQSELPLAFVQDALPTSNQWSSNPFPKESLPHPQHWAQGFLFTNLLVAEVYQVR